ncbi:MAG: prepilin-type N-terminal cleavage/methylation domain-containing protein [Thermodesulfobacteriota bacterium]|nr:prepilin-type N-terminal cleavage/methylation domain-containing protein [Thermodesulfobacteriota bacterium]
MNKNDEKGFSLIEILIAITVFAIGILAVGEMQIHAIVGNSDAAWRSSANSITVSFLEEFRRMPFNDAMLKDINTNGIPGLDDGQVTSGALSSPSSAEHRFNGTIGPTYHLNNGYLVDAIGRQYQVFWNVADNTMPSGEVASKVIRLFVYWQSQMGSRSAIMTTVKYNNISL